MLELLELLELLGEHDNLVLLARLQHVSAAAGTPRSTFLAALRYARMRRFSALSMAPSDLGCLRTSAPRPAAATPTWDRRARRAPAAGTASRLCGVS